MTLSGPPTEALGPSPISPGGDRSPGTLFAGRYRIEGLLGRGGYGGVYRARDERLDRSLALKVIDRAEGGNGGDLDALLAEPRTVARLDHPHIVPVYDAGVENGVPWISSRLVDGQDLKEILRDCGPLGRETVLRLLVQAASALAHAHVREIVHRDIKPGNLLLEIRDDGSEHLWITDFGIAKLLRGGAETTNRIIGTPAYMAPEQMSGERVDERTDLFALGCVAAELLTGRQVFDGQSIPEIMPPALGAQLEELAGTEMTAVIYRCLARRPEDRWPTVQALERELRALTGAPIHHPRSRVAWWPFRRRTAVVWDQPVVATGVRKKYGFGRPILDGVDLTIERGAVYALLGRNGCGKTTLIRTLLGIYRRDEGNISLFGRDPQDGDPEILRRVGFVPDTLAVDESMRVREILDFTAHFYPRWDRAWCHQLLARYDLPLEPKIRDLSRGMQTKVSLVLALAHRPELLILDDATLGLDAIVLAELTETIQEVLRQEGSTALLASHNYEEMELLATHVGLLRNGRIELSDRLESLRRKVREVHITFYQDVPDLHRIDGFRITKTEGRRVTGWTMDAVQTSAELRKLEPEEISFQELSLREMFVELLR